MKWIRLLCGLSLLSSLALSSATTMADEVINWQLQALETQLKLDQVTIELIQCKEENEIVRFWLNKKNLMNTKSHIKESQDVLNEYKKSLEPSKEVPTK